jgi:hypothetical protein
MRNALLLVVLACTLPMAGCLTLSLYPLYTAKDVVADLPLEGKWADAEAKDVWDIRRGGDVYIATDPSNKNDEPIEMRVVRLGEQSFLDLTSNNAPSLAIAAHLFGRIRMTGDQMQIQVISDAWLEKKARETGLPLLELPDKDVLLTAPTADLQRFILRYAGDPDAFEKPETLHRIP